VRIDDRMYFVLRRVALGASPNYVLLLPKFPEALIFNLPSCSAYWNRRAKRNRSFLHARAILTLTTLDEPPNWENVRCNWHIHTPFYTARHCVPTPNGLPGFTNIRCVSLESLGVAFKRYSSSRFDRLLIASDNHVEAVS